MGRTALAYAENGWKVLPCRERTHGPRKAKAPYTANGFHDASDSATQIRQWWGLWPDAMIGLAIPRGVVVIDIDHPVVLADLETLNGGPLPATLTCATGRAGGGTHYYYQTDTRPLSQRGIHDTDGHMIHGVDVRIGGRGYVIAPPSVHPVTGALYEWINTEEIAPLPDSLADAMMPPVPRTATLDIRRPVGGYETCEGLLETMKNAPEGKRNDTLLALRNQGCSEGLKPPASSRLLAV